MVKHVVRLSYELLRAVRSITRIYVGVKNIHVFYGEGLNLC